MKTFLLGLAAAVVGTAAGLACSVWQFGLPGSGDPFDPAMAANPASGPTPLPVPAQGLPRLVAMPKEKSSSGDADAVDARTGELKVEFGIMPQHASRRAEFVFRNLGDGPLELKKGQSTCQCTVGELAGASESEPNRTRVNPGEETVVALVWKTEGPEGPFRHTADIETNDPRRPVVHLVVSGNLTRGMRIEPHVLTLGRVGFRQGAKAQFDVVAFQSDNLEVLKCEWVPPPEGAAGGDPLAKLSEFSTQKLALTDVQAIEPGAQSGCRVTLSVKPGLPLGRIDRKIRITTNFIEPVEMQVFGTVAGDISVAEVGAWYPQFQEFRLGQIRSDEGASKPLLLIVGGENSKNIQVKVKQTVPPELQATVGTPQPAGDMVRWPITISIPRGTRAMSHASEGEYGKVILETNHPDHKEFVINVNFLVSP
jgi:hypothetical protein